MASQSAGCVSVKKTAPGKATSQHTQRILRVFLSAEVLKPLLKYIDRALECGLSRRNGRHRVRPKIHHVRFRLKDWGQFLLLFGARRRILQI
jgi:hypothetical protein